MSFRGVSSSPETEGIYRFHAPILSFGEPGSLGRDNFGVTLCVIVLSWCRISSINSTSRSILGFGTNIIRGKFAKFQHFRDKHMQVYPCLSRYLQGFIHPRWCRIFPSTVALDQNRAFSRALVAKQTHMTTVTAPKRTVKTLQGNVYSMSVHSSCNATNNMKTTYKNHRSQYRALGQDICTLGLFQPFFGL